MKLNLQRGKAKATDNPSEEKVLKWIFFNKITPKLHFKLLEATI